MRVAILGRTKWLHDAAHLLANQGHEMTAIITAPAAPEYAVTPDHFAQLAAILGCPFAFFDGNTTADLNKLLAHGKPDVVVSVNWPTILNASTCAIANHGILNAHCGDLPRYRGNACPNWAIIADEPYIGMCIHRMEAGAVDAGAIHVREHLPNSPGLYIADVYAWLDETVPVAFVKALHLIETPGFAPLNQLDLAKRPLRCHPRRPSDNEIDWSRDALHIQRLVRASSRPFSGAFSKLEGNETITVWRARVGDLDHDFYAVPGQLMGRAADGAVRVACGTGVLEIEEAETASGKPLTANNRFRLFSRQQVRP